MLAVWLLISAILSGGPVAAQESEDGAAEARRLFQEADRAIDEDRLADARDLLRRSLDLAPHPATAFNLAMVSTAMGEHRAAIEILEQLEGGDYGALEASQRAEVTRMISESRGELALVDVGVGSVEADVRVDGELLATVAPGERAEARLDPGRHIVTVRTADGRVEERAVDLEAGDERRIDFQLEPSTGSTDDARISADGGDEVDEDDGGSIVTSPWLWLGVAALVAGGVVLAVVLTTQGADAPEDPVWGAARPLLTF
jgi:hypothetical protein